MDSVAPMRSRSIREHVCAVKGLQIRLGRMTVVPERKSVSEWVATWSRAAAAVIDKVKRDELRTYDYSESAGLIDDLLQIACEH